MANRYAPYRARYLTREPRTVIVKFTATNSYVGEMTLTGGTATSTGPFNHGIVNVVADADGVTTINLGSTSTSRDSYTFFAGIDLITDQADRRIGHITNASCNHATNPNIAFKIVDTDDVNAILSDDTICYIRLHFLDSTD